MSGDIMFRPLLFVSLILCSAVAYSDRCDDDKLLHLIGRLPQKRTAKVVTEFVNTFGSY
jgi:hypothetical protein